MHMVLDASVLIAATRPNEPAYQVARARVERVLTGRDTLLLPSIFVAEVSGALARQGRARSDVWALLDGLCKPPHEIVTIGPRRARRAADVAIACKLRGPDATYVWLAAHEGVPLCTLDKEILTRGAAACQVMTP